MKKFLCFAIAASLALAPVAVFADEYDNGENGYEYEEYDNGEEYEAEEYDNGEEYVEVEEISAELGFVWTFGMGEEAIGAWFVPEFYDVDPISGDVNFEDSISASVGVDLPGPGTFYVTASVVLENAVFNIVGNKELIAEGDEDSELYFVIENEDAYDFFLAFNVFVADYEDGYEASASWTIEIRKVVFEVEEDEEDEDYDDVQPADEEEQDAIPMDSVEIRYVNGAPFVAFRAAANAYGFNQLAWNRVANTVSVLVDGEVYFSFVVSGAGGFNDNGTIYVPLSFALEAFEG